MDQAEFDRFAAEYEHLHRANIRRSGEGPEYFAEYKVADMRREWTRHHPADEPNRILDFGGGVGASAPFLRRYFPDAAITLADVSQKSLAIAAARQIDRLDCLLFDGVTLPLAGASVDLVLAACVFHHIPEQNHVSLIVEIRRVLRPGGVFLLFEHNPWNPVTVRAVDTCPFDENAVLIPAPRMRERMKAGGFTAPAVRFRVFVPGALRRLRFAERGLTWLPLGAQYYIRGCR